MDIVINDLPKISLNEWYSGKHWSKRNKIKNDYKWLIRTKQKFKSPCNVVYTFTWKSRALDCSNCVAMVKMIEDILFPKDDIKVVKSIKIISQKGIEDSVRIHVEQITN